MPDQGNDAGASATPTRFFISYRRRAERDAALAAFLRERLTAAGHEVFIDVDMPLGTRWSEEIDRQISRSGFLIVILSAETVDSEMVLAEVRLAHQRQAREGRPLILPVRVDYTGPLGYELGAYLDPLQYELWRTPADNARIAAAILAAVTQPQPAPATEERVGELPPDRSGRPQPSVDRRTFMQPGGLVPPKDPFYVARDADTVVERLAAEPGITLVVKAPRQMGTSSLLVRYMTAGMAARKKRAFIDLQALAETQLANYPTFLACFVTTLLRRLGLKADDLPTLESGLDVTSLIESRVFPDLDQPLLLAFDEADRLLGRSWQTDFFGMLRVWHNSRWQPGWSGVDIALVIATEPYLLVAEEHQSLFNVGEVVALAPFRPEGVASLNELYGAPLRDSECAELYQLCRGQPYLTRVALHRLVTVKGCSWPALQETADHDDGPFADHLKALLMRLHRAGLEEAMRTVIRQGRTPGDDRGMFYRLKGAGLAAEEGSRIVPANLLYARFFRRVLTKRPA